MNRRDTVLALLALGAAPLSAFAQQTGKVRRIGFLALRSRSTASNPDPYYDAFVQGLRDIGYVEGKNLSIEWRFADGKTERLRDLAAELVQLNVEVIATHATPPTLAARQATNTIPIVSAAMADPVGSRLVASLRRPGGNVTGFTPAVIDISPKQVELLKIIVPNATRIACLVNLENPTGYANLRSIEAAAAKIGMSVLPVSARTPEEIDAGFAAMASRRVDALIVLVEPFLISRRRQIVDSANSRRLPGMYPEREFVEAGGLISYGQNLTDYYRRAATLVDKILNGAKPGDLPIEQPTTIHLALNRKTAKLLGLRIPSEIMLRADEVIE